MIVVIAVRPVFVDPFLFFDYAGRNEKANASAYKSSNQIYVRLVIFIIVNRVQSPAFVDEGVDHLVNEPNGFIGHVNIARNGEMLNGVSQSSKRFIALDAWQPNASRRPYLTRERQPGNFQAADAADGGGEGRDGLSVHAYPSSAGRA